MSSWRAPTCPALCLTIAFLPTAGLVFAQGHQGGVRDSGSGSGNNTSKLGTLTQPLFVTGKVVMFNGEPPPGQVAIERYCSVSDARTEGYTDEEGRFNLQLGLDRGIVAEPSAGNSDRSRGNILPQGPTTGVRFWHCGLRANLPGYISTTISLSGRHYSDSPDVGYIVLRPFEETEGLSISATTALAPKASRLAFEDGIHAIKNKRWKDAEKSLKKAVKIFDRHAEAWYQLGWVYQQRKNPDKARAAFLQATKADPNYVFPYEGLYLLAFRRDDMPDVLDKTETLLRLNPYEFPLAYYYSAVANLQLKHFDAGEKRIRAAIQMDPGHKNPMSLFVLGYIMASKGELAEAVDSLESFLELKPNGAPAKQARAAVEKLQAILARRIPRAGRPHPESNPPGN